MELEFLGTGASEGIPGIFCNCSICKNAIKKGGKEIRKRSCVLIDKKIMIDFSSDIFYQRVKQKIDLTAVSDILFTHSHCDHFNINDLSLRHNYASMNRTCDTSNVYSNETIYNKIRKDANFNEFNNLEMQIVKDKVPVQVGEYKFTPIKEYHILCEDSFVYIIEKDGKTFFYCTDSSELCEDTINYFINNNIKLNGCAFDCTFGLLKEKYPGHMNFNQVINVVKKLKEKNILVNNSKIYITHIAHCGNATHKQLQKVAKKHKINVAYDGLKIKI